MAAAKYQGSSSSSFSRCKYQAFLSFRGDTRKNFTDHLYTALDKAGIHTFRDDDEIRRGENIALELQKGIQQSKVSIIVFSKDYASSRWCLDEVVMIMEHSRIGGCTVIPVFYDVDPSDVRKQTGSFAKAFEEHEKRFKEEMNRVNGWRNALKDVADVGGMVLGDQHEAKFVQSIVEKVSKKLDRKIFHLPLQFIGRDSMINCINLWLQPEFHGPAIAILYGIGGVGKTTIAKSVYNENFDKFEGRSFLANVRERSKDGLVCLQRQLLSDILNKTADEIYDIDQGIMKIKDVICCKRTLIVLDDVDKRYQFKALVGMQNWLYPGSKIIITTRNKDLISVQDQCIEYKVIPLDKEESLELFSWHAFGQADPIEDFAEHSKRIVCHCNGLPLALRVIGSSLSRKGTKVWESALQKMEVIPNCEVQKVLRVSYDSLDDEYDKNLFLDIACFFDGMDEDYVVRILDGLGIGARYTIDNFINRCLVEIDKVKRLWMHQLIKDMGRGIACEESTKCQRIWHHKEALTVLKEATQHTEAVRGLALDMHLLMEDNCTKVVCSEDLSENSVVHHQHNLLEPCLLPGFFSWKYWLSNIFLGEQLQTSQTSLFPVLGRNALGKMRNVKFLQLNYLKLGGNYDQFPKSLVWLCWHGFSLRSIPNHFCLEKLVVLDLSRSSLVDVWKGKMSFPKLKILDLSHSYDLIRTPDFSGLPILETLMLEDCIHLVQFHESIGDLQRLLILNLRNCKSLAKLPEEVSRLNSLEKLVLDGCSNLDGLNIELEQLQRKRSLQSDGIVANTSNIAAMLLKLFFRSWFSTMKISRFITFSLPCSLVELNLDGTPIRSLPESIKGLTKLYYLYLRKCQMLQTLPELPSNLLVIDVSSCYSLQRVTNLICIVIHEDCDQLVQVQDLIKLELTQKLDLHMLRIMETVVLQIQASLFQVILEDTFIILLKGSHFLRFYKEEDEWLIQSEFQELSFKISSPSEHQICGFNFFIMFFAFSEFSSIPTFHVEIKNNTTDKSVVFSSKFALRSLEGEFLTLSHWKYRGNDLEFGNGDEVSVSVQTYVPGIEIKKVGVRIMYEEEGNIHDIQSNNEVLIAHNCSCAWDNQVLGDERVARARIASHVFRYYYCGTRMNGDYYDSGTDLYYYVFRKK